jgi:hypothetical protein
VEFGTEPKTFCHRHPSALIELGLAGFFVASVDSEFAVAEHM